MKRKSTLFLLIGLLAVVLFIGSDIIPAQVKITKKPPKVPSVTCNDNDNCEYEEYDYNKSWERQPCPDCLPKTYGLLNIQEQTIQIAAYRKLSGDPQDWRPARVTQIQHTNNPLPDTGGYAITWESKDIDQTSHGVCVGDVDNDGFKEIIAINAIKTTEGRGKNKITYYNHEVWIFEQGDGLVPTSKLNHDGEYVGGPIDQVLIVDIDNDDSNELVVMKSGTSSGVFEVYQIEQPEVGTHTLTHLYDQVCTSVQDGGIWSMEVADVDNDTENEVLLARFLTTRPYILEFDKVEGAWSEVGPDLIDEIDPSEAKFDDGTINFNVFRVADVDNDPENEIIAGGNNDHLMIWEYNSLNGRYEKTFSSGDLNPDYNHFTWALDVGDVDGDSVDEIVVGIGAGGVINNSIRIFKFNNGGNPPYENYQEMNIVPLETGHSLGLDGLRIANLDGDSFSEIITGQNGITIYKLNVDSTPFELVRVYNHALINDFKIK